MRGRRTKPTRKASALRFTSLSIEKPIVKEEDSVEDHPESSSSPGASNKVTQTTRQNLSPHDASQSVPNKQKNNGAERWEAKLDLWKPLNCLVEVASRSKSLDSNIQGCDAKQEPIQINENDTQVQRSKIKDIKRTLKVENEKIVTDPTSTDTAKANKLCSDRQKTDLFWMNQAYHPKLCWMQTVLK